MPSKTSHSMPSFRLSQSGKKWNFFYDRLLSFRRFGTSSRIFFSIFYSPLISIQLVNSVIWMTSAPNGCCQKLIVSIETFTSPHLSSHPVVAFFVGERRIRQRRFHISLANGADAKLSMLTILNVNNARRVQTTSNKFILLIVLNVCRLRPSCFFPYCLEACIFISNT